MSTLAELHGRLRPCFGRVEPFEQARKYITGLISDLLRKNGWTIAEHVGDGTPDRTQRLLNHAVWDHNQAMTVVRRYVAEQLRDQELRVAALDESGQEKQGACTAGVKRQYMGCAGRIANGVNTVYCPYATTGGHALVGARIYLTEDQLADAARRDVAGIPQDVTFRTKPQLAQDILTDMIAKQTMPPWAAGDEVYDRSGPCRSFGWCVRVDRLRRMTSVGAALDAGTSQGAVEQQTASGQKAARKGNESEAWQRMALKEIKKDVKRELRCSVQSYGQEQQYFLGHPCEKLDQQLFALSDVQGNIIVGSVVWVTMPSAAMAAQFKQLEDTYGTGDVTPFGTEVLELGHFRFTGKHYKSRLDGSLVVIAEAEPARGQPSDALLNSVATVADVLPPL